MKTGSKHAMNVEHVFVTRLYECHEENKNFFGHRRLPM
jgi:hypothetical protein